MCKFCEAQPLIKAIDQLIALAEDDLTSELKDEGFADPQDTAKRVSKLEDELAEALMDETDYIVGEFKQCSSLDEADRKWGKITSGDTAAATISAAFQAEFEEMMPQTIQYYLQQTDRSLKLTEVSQRTTSWVESWSKELGQIMQLNSQKEIESILTTGLKSGQGIDDFTRQIMQSGIRDEYYKARRAALTEVLRAHSVAQQEAFMQSPSVQSKRWRHTGSYRNEPRWNHMDIDGQIVRKDQPFTLAGADGGVYYPMYPRDSSLPPGESINCHCLSEPIVDDSILGLSLEEREALQQQAIDDMNSLDAATDGKSAEQSALEALREARAKDNVSTMRQDLQSGKYADVHEARIAYLKEEDLFYYSDEEYAELEKQLDIYLGDNWRDADTSVLDQFVFFADSYDGEIYRGMYFDPDGSGYDSFVQQCKTQGRISSSRNMSWSSDRVTAEEFSCADDDLDSVILVCGSNRTSVPVNYLTDANEREVLSSSGARWNVVGITETEKEYGGRMAIIEVEEAEYDPEEDDDW